MATQKQLQSFLKEVQGIVEKDERTVSFEEFVGAFKEVVSFAKQMKQDNMKDVATMKDLSKKERDKLASKHEKSVSELNSAISKALNSLTDDQRAGMNLISDKINSFNKKQAKIESSILKELAVMIPELPEIQMTSPEETRNKLERLRGDERLTYKAIAGLQEELEEIKKTKGKVGGGGTSAMGVRYALGSTTVKETPTGDIDGVNTTYTVGRTINLVLSLVINGQYITDDEYTVAGKTIEMDTALPVEFSGTSFRVVYI